MINSLARNGFSRQGRVPSSSQLKVPAKNAGPVLRECRVVVKRLSTADILQRQRPNTAQCRTGADIASTRSDWRSDGELGIHAQPGSSKAVHSDPAIPSSSTLSPLEPDSSAATPIPANSLSTLQSDNSARIHPSHLSHHSVVSYSISPERPENHLGSPNADLPRPERSLDPSSNFKQRLEELEKTVIRLKTHMARLCVIISHQREEIDNTRRNYALKLNQMERIKQELMMMRNSCRCQQLYLGDPTCISLLRRGQKRKLGDDCRLNHVVGNANLDVVGSVLNQGMCNGDQTLLGNEYHLQEMYAQNAGNTQMLDQEATYSPKSPMRLQVVETHTLLEDIRGATENKPNQEHPLEMWQDQSMPANIFEELDSAAAHNNSNPINHNSAKDIESDTTPPKRIRVIETKKLLKNSALHPESAPDNVECLNAYPHMSLLSCAPEPREWPVQMNESLLSATKQPTYPNEADDVEFVDAGPDFSVLLPKVSDPLESPMQVESGDAVELCAFPEGWFLTVPSSTKRPPTPYPLYCFSCYETNVEIRDQHCVTCWSKMEKLKNEYLKDAETPLPQCTHHLSQPMRGCEGCILRAFILRYNLRNPNLSFAIPYHRVEPSIHKKHQMMPGSALGESRHQDVISLCSSLHNQQQNLKTRPCKGDSLFPRKNRKILPKPAGKTPQDESFRISSSVEYPMQSNKVSPFPENWFLEVPDHQNILPTPVVGCCYSCYEYKEKLHLQHCEDCWSKAESLKNNYLKNPKVLNPRCSHPLNKPMRGCDACVLRAFVVRYNLRNLYACFEVPYYKVHRLCEPTNNAPQRNLQNQIHSPLLINMLHNSNTSAEATPYKTTWTPPVVGPEFPDDWFLSVSDDPNERPTPRYGQCVSCYTFKISSGKHCHFCNALAGRMKKRYLKDPNVVIPSCTHQLNRPVRGCQSCSLRNYIISYNERNPRKPFPIPYDKVAPPWVFLQSVNPTDNRTETEVSTDSSELSIISVRTLNPPPSEYFSFGWFLKVPCDPYELPTPRHGCCLSCYEYKPRVDGHCHDCFCTATALEAQFMSDPDSPLPQCTHKLNEPMRGCVVCKIRAYIIQYNRRSPGKHFSIPYELVDIETPVDRIKQLMIPRETPIPSIRLWKKNKAIQQNLDQAPDSAVWASMNQQASAEDLQNSPDQSRTDKMEPFPENWFSQTSSDLNTPPTPHPGHCKSCYEFIHPGFNGVACVRCRSGFRRAKRKHLMGHQGYELPECEHELNLPMRSCFGCAVKAYAYGYRQRHGHCYFNPES